MKRLVTLTMSIDIDGDDYHIRDSLQTHGNSFAEVYRGMCMIRDEVQRQINERKKCPFNPKNVREHGEPKFDG